MGLRNNHGSAANMLGRSVSRGRRENMSEYRKIHISLTDENYQLVRKLAFEADGTKSDVINFLIEDKLGKRAEPVPVESMRALEATSQAAPTGWTVTALRNR
jgi:hypothetical protein